MVGLPAPTELSGNVSPTVSINSVDLTPLHIPKLVRTVVDTRLHLPDMFELTFLDTDNSIISELMVRIGSLVEVYGGASGNPQAECLIKGEITSIEPRIHGGNIDNKLLTAGSTLFLPVWAPGALFSCGDGHGIQGDGEVCINGLEMALTGTFTFILHKSSEMTLSYPRAETPDYLISMGFHADLDDALVIALREMIGIICERTNLSPTEAYQLCSLAADFAITQAVNGEKGVHGKIAKSLLAPK